MQHFSADKTYALFLNPANRKIISELEVIGAKTILFPAADTREMQIDETKNLVELLANSDWLIFTDIYTVEFFLQQLEKSNFDFFELDEIWSALTANPSPTELRFVQLHADIIPNSTKTPEVLQTIKEYFVDENELKAARFLVLKEKNATVGMTNELTSLGSSASELPVYEVLMEKESEITKLKSLLVGGAIDEFIFTSPFDIINLAHLFPTENLENVLAEIQIYAADNATSQSIQEFRLRLN